MHSVQFCVLFQNSLYCIVSLIGIHQKYSDFSCICLCVPKTNTSTTSCFESRLADNLRLGEKQCNSFINGNLAIIFVKQQAFDFSDNRFRLRDSCKNLAIIVLVIKTPTEFSIIEILIYLCVIKIIRDISWIMYSILRGIVPSILYPPPARFCTVSNISYMPS